MGVETKPTSFRLPDEALRQLDELQHAFSPAAKNRADCLTLLVALAHSAVIVRGRIATAIERMQRLLSSEFVAQTEIEFPAAAPIEGRAKPLGRAASRGSGASRRLEVNGLTRRVAVARVAGEVVGIGSYRSLSSPARIRFSYAQFNRGAA